MAARKPKINSAAAYTLVGEHTVIEGSLRSAGNLRIEGEILGDIECEGDVMVGGKACIKSNVTARNMIVAGKVLGNATVKNKLIIYSTGQLHGNPSCGSLNIEKGGVILGISKMHPRSDS